MKDEDSVPTHRATDVVTVSQLGQQFLRPERIRIQLDRRVKALPVDIGCIAYSVRGKNNTHLESRGTPVVENSLIGGRRDILLAMFDWFATVNRHSTIYRQIVYFIKIFDWLDASGHSDSLADIDLAKIAYQEYSDHLYHKISMGHLKPISAGNDQRGFGKLAELCFSEQYRYITNGATAIQENRGDTPPPKEALVARYVSTSLCLARQLSEQVMKWEKFPLLCQFDSYSAVVFPLNGGVFSPYTNRKLYAYNPEERRVATFAEAERCAFGYGSIKKGDIHSAVSRAQENLDAVNADPRHPQYIRFAVLAAKAYAFIVLAITGASPTELSQFDYIDAVEIEKSLVKKELSAVKFRANGKVTRYAIGRGDGLEILKEYLKLRSWLLNGESCDLLFFVKSTLGEFEPLALGFTKNYHRAISGIFLDSLIPPVSSRGLRKYKSVVLHGLRVSPDTVASVLNQTVNTNLSDYSQGSPERHQEEFSGYWRAIRQAAKVVRERAESDAIAVPTGHCDSFLNPEPIRLEATIQPNCKTQYGCLYCEHYLCHADEEDVHKLMSLQYVIDTVRDCSPDLAHAEDLYKDLSIRIRVILDEIAGRSENGRRLISEMTVRVHDLGELTVFWERRLQRYEMLGIEF